MSEPDIQWSSAKRSMARSLMAQGLLLQPVLTIFALVMFAAMMLTLVLLTTDPRTLRDVAVWAKPAKFMGSTALFCLTTVWFMHLLPPAVRQAPACRIMAWVIVGTSLFEVGYISVQAGAGAASHYNVDDLFHGVMFGLMAVAAVLLTATQAFLAWQIARHTVQRPWPVFPLAVITGLVLTFALSTVSGFMLGGQQPPAGVGLPIVGWHLTGGDVRPAHFLGVHAQQLIPLAGLVLGKLPSRQPARGWLVAGVLGYLAVWLWLGRLGLTDI